MFLGGRPLFLGAALGGCPQFLGAALVVGGGRASFLHVVPARLLPSPRRLSTKRAQKGGTEQEDSSRDPDHECKTSSQAEQSHQTGKTAREHV